MNVHKSLHKKCAYTLQQQSSHSIIYITPVIISITYISHTHTHTHIRTHERACAYVGELECSYLSYFQFKVNRRWIKERKRKNSLICSHKHNCVRRNELSLYASPPWLSATNLKHWLLLMHRIQKCADCVQSVCFPWNVRILSSRLFTAKEEHKY